MLPCGKILGPFSKKILPLFTPIPLLRPKPTKPPHTNSSSVAVNSSKEFGIAGAIIRRLSENESQDETFQTNLYPDQLCRISNQGSSHKKVYYTNRPIGYIGKVGNLNLINHIFGRINSALLDAFLPYCNLSLDHNLGMCTSINN